ncbi:MAG: bifunctional folylpolyglutamate synthase/dihydrofolate synthase [Bacteroidales bacterium]|nr:bifunctional folylpolyglutamate synthase/dihydrofolate synthase [Bacteroidales bacterium]
MNYNETLDFLFKQLPMYQRVGEAAYKANLDNTVKLDNYLNNPHKKFKSIHIAGTNGKGSVAHSIASVLHENGYKVGLYTSPHYLDFRERIKINGKLISKDYVVDFVQKHSPFFSALKPSFFEITVAMAFDYFANQQVDFAVIEVGMGGRLDSTNIITPILSIITNIGFDHTQFLGNELSLIAKEKAEIIKKDVPAIISEKLTNLKSVFSNKAQQVDAPVFFTDHNYFVQNYFYNSDNQIVININKHQKIAFSNLIFGLSGLYQLSNILTVVQAIDVLQKNISITEKSVYDGLKNVVKNTGIMGRWQILSTNPYIICDAGHNFDGISMVINQIHSLNYANLHFIFGSVNDKDMSKIFKLLPSDAKYYFTKAQIVRALDEKILKNSANSFQLVGQSYTSVDLAIHEAIKNYNKGDLIFIGGSTFIVAEAIEFFSKKI